jgi:ribonuclease P protein component
LAGTGGERLRRREKLTIGVDYRRVFRRGIRLDGPFFLMVALDNDRGYGRLGLAASRRVGGAVARNRAKRMLRESFRRNKPLASGFDLVLVPKREIVEPVQAEVEREYRERLRRLVSRRTGAGRARVAPPR